RAAHAGRLAGRGAARDTVRNRHPRRPLAARVPRPERSREGTRRRAARRVAQRSGGAPRVSAHGGARHLSGAGRAMDRLARVARCRSRPRSVAAARDRPRRADGAHRGRGRLDGDGAGPAAVGDLRRAQDRGRRHADAGPDRALPHVHAALLFPGCDRRVAPVPAYPAESGDPGVAWVLYARQRPGKREGGRGVTLADLLAGVIFVSLNAYGLLGGADFGGGVWDLLARGSRKERQRDLIAHAIGPAWEANRGGLAVAGLRCLAAVYLTLEATEPGLREDCRGRAVGAGVALFGAALLVLELSGSGAPRVRAGLIFAPCAVPLHLLTGAAAVTALAALWRRRYRVARVAAAAQVSLILWGWAVSQYPYLLPPDLTIVAAAAPDA